MRVGIFGGTFDPIHNGHLLMAEEALEKCSLDKVIFIPSNIPPHKQEQSVVSPYIRYEMVRLAIEDNPKFEISDVELFRKGLSYSVDTVKEIKKEYKGSDVFFITGADAINELNTWHKANDLLKNCRFIALSRPKVKLDMEKLAQNFGDTAYANIKEISARLIEISSSDIRNRVIEQKNISYMVPYAVAEYIKKEGLYKLDEEGMRKLLKTRLKEKRYIHSLGVANTAVLLAQKFGVDKKKAYIAGLLHDSAREYKDDELLSESIRRGIEPDEIQEKMPLLLHAPLGAFVAAELYGVSDDEILNAIVCHTVGGHNMTDLDKIIYFADMIEPNRDYPGVDELREYAKYHALDDIMLKALSESIAFVAKKGGIIHPDTILARNELIEKLL